MCFRATHPPVRVLSEFPISPVPLPCLLLTCVRIRLLQSHQLVMSSWMDALTNLLVKTFACAFPGFAEGEGFEPPMFLRSSSLSEALNHSATYSKYCLRPLGQPSKICNPDFSRSSVTVPLEKPANFSAGWLDFTKTLTVVI